MWAILVGSVPTTAVSVPFLASVAVYFGLPRSLVKFETTWRLSESPWPLVGRVRTILDFVRRAFSVSWLSQPFWMQPSAADRIHHTLWQSMRQDLAKFFTRPSAVLQRWLWQRWKICHICPWTESIFYSGSWLIFLAEWALWGLGPAE